jgi:hypothetical protein
VAFTQPKSAVAMAWLLRLDLFLDSPSTFSAVLLTAPKIDHAIASALRASSTGLQALEMEQQPGPQPVPALVLAVA